MKADIEQRACLLAQYIIENKATVRAAGAHFGVSKSTVHTEVTITNGLYGSLDKHIGHKNDQQHGL